MALNRKKIKRIFSLGIKIAAVVVLLCIAGGIIFFIRLIDTTKWKDFDPSKLENLAQTLVFYDKDGNEVGGMHSSQNRTNIPLSDMPDSVQKALIATEDTRFYSHHGVDFQRIIGALWADLRGGSLSEGASTISQQLIKNTHLTNEKTWTRKLQEARLAMQLEQVYSKDQILEMYLNTVYFGKGAYGIEAAAESYFGIHAKELTLSQSALLIGILKGPGIYAPHINMDKSVARRDLILGLMKDQGYINQQQMEAARKEKVVLANNTDKSTQYGFYLDAAEQEAEAITKQPYEDLVSAGYRVYTALDTGLQQQLDDIMANAKNFPADAKDGTQVQSASIVVDSKTGAIKAVVGGRAYTTKFGLNRATGSRRQPGSAIKPILDYGVAIDRFGYTGASMVEDDPVNYGGYQPQDLGTPQGWVTLRYALSKSLNIPAVRILHDIGLESGKDFAGKLGIPFADGDNNLSLALGGFTNGVTPLELAGAYTAFANGGRLSHPAFIIRIDDSDGNTIYQANPVNTVVMSDATAFLMTDILKSTVQAGTATALKMDKIPVYAKTGTAGWNTGNRDVWIASYNPDYVMVTWMGFDKTDTAHVLSSKVTGGSYPAQIQKALYSYLYKGTEGPKFDPPPSVTLVALDKLALTTTGQALLATDLTPEDQKLYEYFPTAQAPTTQSTYWQTPVTPTGFSVGLSTNNLPEITFFAIQDYVRYDLYRIDGFGQTAKVAELKGAANSVVQYEDTTATMGTWQYYILPVHPDLNVTGSPTAAQSVTVPDLTPQPTDTGGGFWNGLFPGIGGNTPAPQPSPAG